MAKNDNLKDFVTDVADAIREKKGTTDLINPQDFSAEIKSIEGGGGSGGGDSEMRYFALTDVAIVSQVGMVASLLKLKQGSSIVITSPAILAFWQQQNILLAIAIDMNQRLYLPIEAGVILETASQTIEFFLTEGGFASIEELLGPEITEAEFYNLTA